MDLAKRIVRRFQNVLFNGRLFIHRALEIPAQTSKEMKIFKKIFDVQVSLKKNKLRVFEWGSGYSTIFYAKYLDKKNIDFEWHSIDNNRVWHTRVMSMVDHKQIGSSVSLYVKEFLPFWEKSAWGRVPPECGQFSPRSENEIAYIRFPLELGINFDIVIIDARFRRHCLQTAKEILSQNGIVLMHDAQKPHYHFGMDDFPYRAFFDTGSWYPLQDIANKIWVGSFDNKRCIDVLNL